MQGSIAQAVALVCHANGSLRRGEAAPFFPENSTCQFCASIQFVDATRMRDSRREETPIAGSPNAWFEHLSRGGTRRLRLSYQPSEPSGGRDFETVGFVGGGGSWWIVSEDAAGSMYGWSSRWLVGNHDAPDRRIWKVTYGRLGEATSPGGPSVSASGTALERALEAMARLSCEHANAAFVDSFEGALAALRTGDPRGYHRDLAPTGILPAPALRLLDACQTGWVLGGMGSWNDQVFDDDAAVEYARVSGEYWSALTAAIVAATNTSSP